MNISTVPNQRTILFPIYKDSKFPVSLVRHLSGNELKLYMYLWDVGDDNGKFILYSSLITKDIECSNKTYFKAFNGLVHNGFLTKEESNTYRFYPNKYIISDKEMMDFTKEYIYSHYGKGRYTNAYTDYSSFRLNPELDIIPDDIE